VQQARLVVYHRDVCLHLVIFVPYLPGTLFFIVYFLVLLLYHLLFSDAAIIYSIQEGRRMSMNMDHWRELENMKRNVSFCRFFHKKSHIESTGIEFGPVRRDAVDQQEL
jgi:hypothetical protein